MSKIFINYRRDDTSGYAGRLYDRLAEHFGEDQVFMDIGHIDPGADFVKVINEKIASCRALIVMIGPQWTTVRDETGARRLDDAKDFVRLEVATALERNALVIPVLLKGAAMPRVQDLPKELAPLARRQAIAITDTRFHQDVDGLIDCIEKAIGPGDPGQPAHSAAPSATDGDRKSGSAPTTSSTPSLTSERSPTRAIPIASIGAILVLSLATWWYFYTMSMPLDPGATIVVVGAWIAIVFLVRRMWAALAKNRARSSGQQ